MAGAEERARLRAERGMLSLQLAATQQELAEGQMVRMRLPAELEVALRGASARRWKPPRRGAW
ncbi:hypothetical protein [Cupriavidus sp. D39]|uniref:hypothetical protein n=1 Tax=Cupriavidus sp. D39 TaxID=2997877 RepID=UPI002270ADEC|nr:hypothetical protein [Cupriavidus sp. D39]MCY0853344.1 hypothetical protein [Cupriavidus sp. D39]